jgi:hypothetical protein
MRSPSRTALLLSCFFGSASGCALEMEQDDEAVDDFHGVMLDMKSDDIGSLVKHHVSGACSTAGVAPLARQIAEEMLCMAPGVLARLEPGDGIDFRSSAVLPYMEESAADDLRRAAAETPITLNSGFRAVVQQFLLREWFDRGRCGISAAARPGRSNHETGRAIDVSATAAQKAALRRHGWTDPLPHDPVHFEHLASPDLRGMDVHAFQRLWNRNHPEDPIDEDGDWGASTRKRMLDSPAGGFPEAPQCSDPPIPDDPSPDDDQASDCAVAGEPGTCIDTNTTACTGQIHTGFCPGPNNIRCCVQ